MRLLLASLFLLSALLTKAQDEKKWYVPEHVKLQFAGNLGFISGAVGYQHGKDKLETDFHVGYLPKSIGGDHIITVTGKFTYFPWNFPVRENYRLSPFSIGAFLNYSFGSQFDTILPNEYPDGYYWWATSLRFGSFMGGKLERDLNSGRTIGIYYELGTYDLKFLSYIQNTKTIGLHDVINLALGVKMTL